PRAYTVSSMEHTHFPIKRNDRELRCTPWMDGEVSYEFVKELPHGARCLRRDNSLTPSMIGEFSLDLPALANSAPRDSGFDAGASSQIAGACSSLPFTPLHDSGAV